MWCSVINCYSGVICAVLFALNVLDEIWDVIESVSEGFLTYFRKWSIFQQCLLVHKSLIYESELSGKINGKSQKTKKLN